VTETSALVRAVICGAVDDGKSTLLGRLLVETESVPLDELESVTTDGLVDYALLTDGLASEREQGITIDVAHRQLSLPDGRRVLMADSPGHEQYTRNMAVAASLADVAVLVIDGERGIRRQSYRHAAICALMGVTHVIVAVTKIDALADPQARFAELHREAGPRLAAHGFASVEWIPTSGHRGDNVTHASTLTPWHSGLTVVDALAAPLAIAESPGSAPLRLAVQTVMREQGQRWYAGRIARGSLAPGDAVRVARTSTPAEVAEVRLGDEPVLAVAGQSIAVRLDREIDLSRGDVLVADDDPAEPQRVWLADMVWLDAQPLELGRGYLLRSGASETPARVDFVRSVVDLDSGDELGGRVLVMNDLGRVELVLDRPLLLDPYTDSRHTGGLVLVDRATARTVAAAMVVAPVERESEVTRHAFAINRARREELNGVRGVVVWLTGLPGSGKSTIADDVERRLFERGVRSFTLDGDTVRSTLSEDLGFTPDDRRENVRRVARVAELMLDAGLVVLVSLVSPFRADRELARERFAADDFIEVFVDTPLEVCEQRDPKGLYARARAAGTSHMTGVGQVYEAPESPELHLDGTAPIEQSVALILELITSRRLR
jgi:bifunctional enzyme CysN/CysC